MTTRCHGCDEITPADEMIDGCVCRACDEWWRADCDARERRIAEAQAAREEDAAKWEAWIRLDAHPPAR